MTSKIGRRVNLGCGDREVPASRTSPMPSKLSSALPNVSTFEFSSSPEGKPRRTLERR
jgi:hypothetical protein